MDALPEVFELARKVAAMPASRDDDFARHTLEGLVAQHPHREEIEEMLVFVARNGNGDHVEESRRTVLLRKGAEQLVYLAKEFGQPIAPEATPGFRSVPEPETGKKRDGRMEGHLRPPTR